MKLIRNQTADGSCKYALILLQKMGEEERNDVLQAAGKADDFTVIEGTSILIGNESPADQFFVLKYKDKFTAEALFAYARAVRGYCTTILLPAGQAEFDSLFEYARQIEVEADKAKAIACKIPD